jgi:ribonucleotide reductase alpha subunit
MLLAEGSIQNIPEIPDHIKKIYKNSWDLSNKVLIDMSADRGAYVCQSQSLNLSIAEPTFKSLSSMHFYSWKVGLKTGIYYLRTMPKTSAQKFTVEPEKKQQQQEQECTSCSG